MLSSERDIRDRFDMYRSDAEQYTHRNRERVVQFVETPTSDSDFQNTTRVVRPSFVPSVDARDEVTGTQTEAKKQESTLRYSRVFACITFCSFMNFILALGAIVLGSIALTREISTRKELQESRQEVQKLIGLFVDVE
jgi:hypothetical protein